MINYGPTEYSGTIVYDSNNGTNSTVSQIVQLGYDQIVANNMFTRTDYTFTGWNTKADGTGTKYTAGQSYTFNFEGKLTLYAQWKKLTYKVKFNGNGSTSGQMQNQIINRIDSTPLRKNQYQRKFKVTYNANGGTQSKEQDTTNQKFNGWAKTQTGQVVYTDQQAVTNIAPANGSITLYAKWDDQEIQLPSCSKIKYQFNGWYTQSGVYIGDAGSKYTVQQDVTFYAKYKQTVMYDQNSDTLEGAVVQGSLPEQHSLDGTGLTLKEKGDLRADGYRFIGWSFTKNPKDSEILTPNTTVADVTSFIDDSGVLTVYAIWSKLTNLIIDPNSGEWRDRYGVELQESVIGPDDGQVATKPTNKTYKTQTSFKLGSSDRKSIEDPVRTGYSFFGWMIG